MTRRRWMALAAPVAGACSRSAPKPELATLRVGYANIALSIAPLLLADEKGYFRQEGIRIEADRTTFTGLHISALAAGKLDVALVAMSPALVNAVIRGAPVRLVASRQTAVACGTWGQLLARRSTFPGGLKDLRELKGKRIAYTTPGSISDFALDAVLDAAHLTRDQIRAIPGKRQESVAGLISGGVDAIMGSSSLEDFTDAQRKDLVRFPGAESVHPGTQASFIAFGERLLGKDRDLGLRFLRAMQRATREFVEGMHPRFVDKWARAAGVDMKEGAAPCDSKVGIDGRIDLPSVGRYLEWAFRKKHVEAEIAPERLLDPSFVGELNGGAAAR